MRRRDFIAALGGAAAMPLAGRAQQAGRTYKLGAVIPAERESPAIAAFFDELRANGFIEGGNLEVIPNGFGVLRERIDAMVETIIKAAPDVIIAGPDRYTRAFQEATKTIPMIVMSEDMVAEGLVASLARPGGNITGISILSPELDTKRLDTLVDAAPGARKIALLADTAAPGTPDHVRKIRDAGRARGIDTQMFGVASRDQALPAIDAAKASGMQALMFLASPVFTANFRELIVHLQKVRLPAMHQWPEMAEAGALIGYGPRFTDVFRQRARLVVRVLRGAKPADIPVEQPTKFELVINLKTAKTIGHDFPAEPGAPRRQGN